MALYSYINKKWLSLEDDHTPTAKVDTAGPKEDWLLIEVDEQAHIYALKSHKGTFLRAVPPAEDEPAVFADGHELHSSAKWIIEPTNIPPARVPK